MPVWHEATSRWVKQGKLAVVGVTQEQHADRGRLFAQWKRFDWPILNDPINLLESKVVPIFVAIDEHGIVRQVGPKLDRFEADFLAKQFDDDAPAAAALAEKLDLAQLRERAESAGSAAAWLEYGDALALWGGPARGGDAIDAYARAVQIDPRNGAAQFRLGVCYRRRFESADRRTRDFQAAVDAWGRALEIDPNQYIWRRRIQQYGPRLDKPYAFYDWVDQAAQDIRGRGERPVELAVKPQAAELAAPIRDFEDAGDARSPDPEGRIARDTSPLIDVDVTVVPARVAPGRSVQVHVQLQPAAGRVHWNNESDPLRLWVDAPDGWRLSRRLSSAAPHEQPESRETRRLDLEASVPATAAGRVVLKAYALYYVCEEVGGQCLYLRRDIDIPVDVAQ